MMFCTKCGNVIPKGTAFCGKCGIQIDANVSQNVQRNKLTQMSTARRFLTVCAISVAVTLLGAFWVMSGEMLGDNPIAVSPPPAALISEFSRIGEDPPAVTPTPVVPSELSGGMNRNTDDFAAYVGTEVEEEIVPLAPEYPLVRHYLSAGGDHGFSADVTVSIGEWVRATDIETLDAAWEAVGGTAARPELNHATFSRESTAYVFGIVRVRNTTPDFPIEFFSVNLSISPNFLMWYQRGSHTDRVPGLLVNIFSPISPNNTVTIPFALSAIDVFNPTNPTGTASILNSHINFTASFPNINAMAGTRLGYYTIGVMWEH